MKTSDLPERSLEERKRRLAHSRIRTVLGCAIAFGYLLLNQRYPQMFVSWGLYPLGVLLVLHAIGMYVESAECDKLAKTRASD